MYMLNLGRKWAVLQLMSTLLQAQIVELMICIRQGR
jgi:hypothetical protein